ncbi:hypothetical protein ABT095_12305 [Kitasatospora sp. NPDC002227]|uniref:hypothetical protein n=1 Tax=Kitasatospora sp. NPDC002227 TaxID=3154773 RepID=UPI0033282BA7
MHTPAISRPAVLAAALGLALALAPTVGSTAAVACGDDAPAAAAPVERHRTDPVSAFLPESATTVAAGGPAVGLGVELGNFTGSAYQHLAPGFAVFGSADAGGNKLVNLQPEQLTVEVMADGAWRRLPLRLSCDPTLVADTSSLAAPLADQHARRYLFRLRLAASVPAKIEQIDVYSGSTAQNRPNRRTLTLTHPAATAPTAGGSR